MMFNVFKYDKLDRTLIPLKITYYKINSYIKEGRFKNIKNFNISDKDKDMNIFWENRIFGQSSGECSLIERHEKNCLAL